jgi:hypothetical protein
VSDAAGAAGSEAAVEREDELVEPRWPVALALLLYIGITVAARIAQPNHESLGPHWLVPSIELALLAALVLADPPRVNRRGRWLRPASIVLVVSLVLVALTSTGILISDLITGGKVTESATALLTSGR